MNRLCRKKDYIYIPICLSMFDLSECSAYKKTGTFSEYLKAIGPMDLQQDLFPRNEPIENDETGKKSRKRIGRIITEIIP